MSSDILKLYNGDNTYTIVENTQVPDNFTTTGSTLLMELYLGSDLTSIDIYAEITTIDVSNFENVTIGEDWYCSDQKPCNLYGKTWYSKWNSHIQKHI